MCYLSFYPASWIIVHSGRAAMNTFSESIDISIQQHNRRLKIPACRVEIIFWCQIYLHNFIFPQNTWTNESFLQIKRHNLFKSENVSWAVKSFTHSGSLICTQYKCRFCVHVSSVLSSPLQWEGLRCEEKTWVRELGCTPCASEETRNEEPQVYPMRTHLWHSNTNLFFLLF